ncbi:hypothetical protein BKH41_02810 [Helicobacter sp. 12S02232-10]|uniref:hypothetical protein n=1 Tax=Helicobacter sp. 12S02232-10 TaxID=1476197 RepID=UPI000BA7852C|nr:hypothetical protein [Helicobacter sp. 12S02232-10]PAF49611.1 hypothetical protein BKH41_02810 [Helicobacter sp. 12S02232-10]
MFEYLKLKFLMIGILVLLALFGLAELYVQHQIKVGIKAGLELENLKNALTSQNQVLLKKSLETKQYLEKMETMKERVITKYKTIHIKDQSCEAELEGVKNALDLFYAAHPDST